MRSICMVLLFIVLLSLSASLLQAMPKEFSQAVIQLSHKGHSTAAEYTEAARLLTIALPQAKNNEERNAIELFLTYCYRNVEKYAEAIVHGEAVAKCNPFYCLEIPDDKIALNPYNELTFCYVDTGAWRRLLENGIALHELKVPITDLDSMKLYCDRLREQHEEVPVLPPFPAPYKAFTREQVSDVRFLLAVSAGNGLTVKSGEKFPLIFMLAQLGKRLCTSQPEFHIELYDANNCQIMEKHVLPQRKRSDDVSSIAINTWEEHRSHVSDLDDALAAYQPLPPGTYHLQVKTSLMTFSASTMLANRILREPSTSLEPSWYINPALTSGHIDVTSNELTFVIAPNTAPFPPVAHKQTHDVRFMLKAATVNNPPIKSGEKLPLILVLASMENRLCTNRPKFEITLFDANYHQVTQKFLMRPITKESYYILKDGEAIPAVPIREWKGENKWYQVENERAAVEMVDDALADYHPLTPGTYHLRVKTHLLIFSDQQMMKRIEQFDVKDDPYYWMNPAWASLQSDVSSDDVTFEVIRE